MPDFLEALTLAASLSLDAWVAAFAYGHRAIQIPKSAIAVISTVCGLSLAASLFLGSLFRVFLSQEVGTILSGLVLIGLGIVKLLEDGLKSWLRRRGAYGQLGFSLFNLHFLLHVYIDPETADADASHRLNTGEAVSLALALSLDGLAVGFGAALGEVNALLAVLAVLAVTALALAVGEAVGRRLARQAKGSLSWLSGMLLVALGIGKLV